MRKKITMIVLLLGVVFLAGTEAKASLVYQLNTTFNGASPTSSAPWLTATFANAGANTVTLTLAASLNVASEFISDVVFNLDPSIVPSSLTIIQSPVVNPAVTDFLNTNQNAQSVQGGGAAGSGFDVRIDWTTSNSGGGIGRFNNNDVVTLVITGTGLTENDFAFTNTGGAAAHVAAHIQGIPGTPGSGAIKDGAAVPIPGAVWLLGSGLLGLIGFRRKFEKN